MNKNNLVIPGVFLDSENATKLRRAASVVSELADLVSDAPNFPESLFELLTEQFQDALDSTGIHFYEYGDHAGALEHLKKEREKIDQAIAELEGKKSAKAGK
jgi:hypothetical protein